MKRPLAAISLLSISLFLGACGSSEPETAADSPSAGSQQEETNKVSEDLSFQKESGPISFDDFELTYTEKDTGLGYTGVYVSVTNHSEFTILFPGIEYELKPGVTKEDVQAVMPNDLKFDSYVYKTGRGVFLNSVIPYLKPSETSAEMVIAICTIEYERPDGSSVRNCPVTQDILDLLEVKSVAVSPIVGGKKKNGMQLKPGETVLAETLEDTSSLFNEVVEGGKDLIIVPDGVSFYYTYEYYNDGYHGYGFDFFDVEETAMDKCIEDYKEKYPPRSSGISEHFYSDSGMHMYMYYGNDREGHELRLQYIKEQHYISGSINDD
ncbi:MAG: hypothetical protein IKG46_13820 [Solobacterium sp.]|nr:hypothetical protein [Solobacterium sp.]